MTNPANPPAIPITNEIGKLNTAHNIQSVIVTIE